MKFSDGNWMVRKGYNVFSAAQVHDVEIFDNSLTVYAPVRRVLTRGDMADGPVITIEFSSPMPDVIRVKLTHFAGELPKLPSFELVTDASTQVTICDDEESATLTSGRLSARVSKTGEWCVDFLGDGRSVTSSGKKGMAIVQKEDGPHYMREQLNLGVGESVYGLGERFTAFVKNGQVVDMWNADGGTCSEQAYKNVPFYLSNRGYGVFVNHPEEVSFEVGSEVVTRVQFSVPGQSLEYYILYGPTPKEVMQKYTALTGRPALPPAWSFGLWLTTSFTTDYDEGTVTGFVQGMADRDLPLHVFHYDCFWMREYHWCDLEWDKRMFPDPEGMLRRLKERGLHICVWINPYIAQRSAMFAEGMEHGYLVKRTDGSVWQWDRWQPGMGLVDFTNQAACEWFAGMLRRLVDMGVDCFKTDFAERIPTDVVYFNGADPIKMHNYYTYLYNRTVFTMLEEHSGKNQAVVFARSATAGSQKFPVHWGGDNSATFESMAESLRGGLSLSLSGFGFWSHDIGGFEHTASADVYKRWCAFGLLSSHSRLHGNHSYRVPWLYDEESVDVLRYYTNLKCRLMPYLFGAACEAHENGIPVMRPMPLEFPGDPGCDTLDREYMLGDSLLVVPVLAPDGRVDYYLPDGTWTNFLSGKKVEGGRWVREQHDYMSLPLMARPNSVIPVGDNAERPDYDYSDGVVFHVFELQDGAALTSVLKGTDGKPCGQAEIRRSGGRVEVRVSDTSKPWAVLLRGVAAVESVQGGSASKEELGMLLTPVARTSEVAVEL